MNVAQIIRKSRLGCDAILPGNTPSRLWQDDELVDLVNEAADELNLQLRMAKKNYGMQTVKYGDTAFTRAGVTYTPSTELQLAAGASSFQLPPDFAEVTRILCLDTTSVRFVHAEFNSQYWIDMEQSARNDDGTFSSSNSTVGQTMYYDITGERTCAITPPTPGTMQLSIDYVPVKRSLVYSNAGTVTLTQGSASVVGLATSWMSDGIYTELSSQRSELIAGFNDLGNASLRLDREYPRVESIADDGHLTLTQPWPSVTVTGSKFIVAMVPTAPADYHRWLASHVSAFMLRKVSPDLSTKYAADNMKRFTDTVQPSSKSRQSQESKVTDDNELMGGLADW